MGPQGSNIGHMLSILYLLYAMDNWLEKTYNGCRFVRYADGAIIHCRDINDAEKLKAALDQWLEACGLELHAGKTQIVCCKDGNRWQKGSNDV